MSRLQELGWQACFYCVSVCRLQKCWQKWTRVRHLRCLVLLRGLLMVVVR